MKVIAILFAVFTAILVILNIAIVGYLKLKSDKSEIVLPDDMKNYLTSVIVMDSVFFLAAVGFTVYLVMYAQG